MLIFKPAFLLMAPIALLGVACGERAPVATSPAAVTSAPAVIASPVPSTALPDPQTTLLSLKLVVVGSLVARDAKASKAFIRVGDQPTSEFMVGNEIAPNVTVLAISPTDVIVGGPQSRRVLLVDSGLPGGGTTSTAVKPAAPTAALIDDVFRKALKDLPETGSK